MNKSDIFNKKFPSPTQNFVRPIYAQFKALQQSIIDNWRDDLINNRLGLRNFVDLLDVRMSVRGKGQDSATPVLSLKPMIGPDVQEQLDYYKTFFELYTLFERTVIELMQQGECVRLQTMDDRSIYKDWLQEHKMSIHMVISLIRIMIIAAKNGNLTIDHLDTLRNVDDLDTVNAMVRDLDVAIGLSDKFAEGGYFYEHPEQEMVSAYWRYARKLPSDIDPEDCVA